MLVLNLPAFESKKYAAYDRLYGSGPHGEIPTKKEPIRTLGFALPYNNTSYLSKARACKWDHEGRVPFDQTFRKFRFKIKWNRKFRETHFENIGQPLEVVLFSGNLEIPEIFCSI